MVITILEHFRMKNDQNLNIYDIFPYFLIILQLFRQNPSILVALPVFTKMTQQQKNTKKIRNIVKKCENNWKDVPFLSKNMSLLDTKTHISTYALPAWQLPALFRYPGVEFGPLGRSFAPNRPRLLVEMSVSGLHGEPQPCKARGIGVFSALIHRRYEKTIFST
jgi:hypothetical protein